jgi:hypothetical protein
VRRSAPLWTEGRAGEIKAAVTAALQGLRGENTGSGGQNAGGSILFSARSADFGRFPKRIGCSFHLHPKHSVLEIETQSQYET